MSEMALTADEVVIIGKGRLIAAGPVRELLAERSRQSVRVRSSEIGSPQAALDDGGAATVLEPDGLLVVEGADAVTIGELAASIPVVLHELAPQSVSLEEAFMELTKQSVEHHGGDLPQAMGSGRR